MPLGVYLAYLRPPPFLLGREREVGGEIPTSAKGVHKVANWFAR